MSGVQQVGLEEMLRGYDGALTLLDEFSRHGADAHLLAAGARCSIWWGKAAEIVNEKVGLIGHYEARDEEAGVSVLEAACGELKRRGCTLAIGPMDGSTWNRYRLVSEFGEERPFFLEPWNPETYPEYFRRAGFGGLASYSSALNMDLGFEDPKNEIVRRRVAEAGIRIREIEPGDFEGELRRIFEVCVVAFRRNFLYTPIGEGEFLAQYA